MAVSVQNKLDKIDDEGGGASNGVMSRMSTAEKLSENASALSGAASRGAKAAALAKVREAAVTAGGVFLTEARGAQSNLRLP